MSNAPVPVCQVRAISANQVRELRHRLLRPFEPPERIVYFGDDAPDTLHAGAFLAGELVGIASVCAEALPSDAALAAWRLRGMATVPQVRGRGYGRALLSACFEHIRARGGSLIWCNARVAALGFYEKLGFVTQGSEFEIPPIGPHFVMTRAL